MIAGGCNCGAVRYEIKEAPVAVAACHCVRCRRQSGSIYSVNLIVPVASIVITGALRTFEDLDTTSGAPVQRQFCEKCGSPIRSLVGGRAAGMAAVKAGTLDDPAPYEPTVHVFTRSKIGWVSIPDGVRQFDANPG